MLPSMESVCDQFTRNNLLKEKYHSINRTKNCLRTLAFDLIDLDHQKVFKDKRKLQVIKELRKDTVILKPDKGNGVLVMIRLTTMNPLTNYFQIRQNSRGLMQILPIPS